MKKIGITGGIGSGKSIICRVFKNLGVPVFTADIEASIVMRTDTFVTDMLIRKFGNEIYLYKGEINRVKLASIMFKTDDAIQYINSVVHPVVKRKYSEWCLEQTSKYSIIETAILFESGVDSLVDKTISVYAPVDIRIKRVMERDNISEFDVMMRIRSQMNEEKKTGKANYIIYNDDQQMVIPQVLHLHNLFSGE